MLWTEYRPVINIGPKGALDSHEIGPIHSAPSLGQSIVDSGISMGKHCKLLLFGMRQIGKIWSQDPMHVLTC